MAQEQDLENQDLLDQNTVKWAVIISTIIGFTVAVYLLDVTTSGDNYSALYIIPGSYSNYLEGEEVVFSYGITNHGKPSIKNILRVYMGDQLVAERDLKQKIGVNEVVLNVPENVRLPSAVKLELETDYGVNEVHFWIKGKMEENETSK